MPMLSVHIEVLEDAQKIILCGKQQMIEVRRRVEHIRSELLVEGVGKKLLQDVRCQHVINDIDCEIEDFEILLNTLKSAIQAYKECEEKSVFIGELIQGWDENFYGKHKVDFFQEKGRCYFKREEIDNVYQQWIQPILQIR